MVGGTSAVEGRVACVIYYGCGAKVLVLSDELRLLPPGSVCCGLSSKKHK